MYKYFIAHKPFNVLSQFTSKEGKKTLKDIFEVPANIYPVGRLDYDSEGLLILTDDPYVNNYLLNPSHKHEREYWVLVEGNITQDAVTSLQHGVGITIDGKMYITKKCIAEIIYNPGELRKEILPCVLEKYTRELDQNNSYGG